MLKIYFDQNVFGHILDSYSDWHDHPIVKCMLEEYSDHAALWLSPTHVIELVQCSDPVRRQKLAQIMLELCGGQRMWSGSDFFLIEQFGKFINSLVPGSFKPNLYFEEYKVIAERLWLGYIGLLAASPSIPLGIAVDKVRLTKAQTELIHARIAANPDKYIPQIISCVKNFETTSDNDLLGLDSLTLGDISLELTQLRSQAKPPTQAQIEKIKKARTNIASVYGSMDIGAALDAVFRLPCDLELTFDIPAIVQKWAEIQRSTGCMSLPKHIATESTTELLVNRSHLYAVLNCCINASACSNLAVAEIGYYTVLRELEVKLYRGDLPKGSISLDVDHAIACMSYDVFFCEDQAFYENMKAFSNNHNDCAKVIRDVKELKSLCKSASS